MGCSSSYLNLIEVLDSDVKIGQLKRIFGVLKLSKDELISILKCFKKIDITGNGSLEAPELEVFLKTERSTFNEKVFFSHIPSQNDANRKLDFASFVIMTWSICSLEEEGLGK